MGDTLYASLGDVRYVRQALVKCTFFGKVLEARGGSVTQDQVPGARLPFLVPPKGGSNHIIIRLDPDKISNTPNSYAHTPNFQNVITGIDSDWSIYL